MVAKNFFPVEVMICEFFVMLDMISLVMVTDKGSAGLLVQYFLFSCTILWFTSSKVSLVRSMTSSSCLFEIPSSFKGMCPLVRGVVGGMSNGEISLFPIPSSVFLLVSPC